ncbi:MAG: hypothetical protein V7K57_21975 [Nostoc sp.]|uniref:hypothetical protein n=1 Tax=Nostoc sp. TaxID=1180 RepID=UPI002FFB479E
MDGSYVLLTLRRYDLRMNAVISYRLSPLAGLWYLLSAGRLLSLSGLGAVLVVVKGRKTCLLPCKQTIQAVTPVLRKLG